jgi:hypothetical protein
VTLLMLLTPATLAVQLPKVCDVSDSFAVPGLPGLLVILALKLDLAHLTPVLPEADERNATEVPDFRLDFTTSPTFTLVPPTFPVVRTSMLAAEAGITDKADSSAVAPAAAKI